MTTPDEPPRPPRVTRPTPRRTGPIRSASLAFRAASAGAGEADADIDEGVRNAYKVYEVYMRQGDEAAGRYGRHGRGGDDGDAWWSPGAREPAAMAWQFWMGMLRAFATIPVEMAGAWGSARGPGHPPRHEPAPDAPHGEGRWAEARARHEAPERVPEAREGLRFEVLADRRVYVALDLPAAARLRAARVGPMRRRDGTEGAVTARITWDPSRAIPEIAIAAEGAEAGVYTGDVTLEGWTSPLGTIQVTVDAPSGASP